MRRAPHRVPLAHRRCTLPHERAGPCGPACTHTVESDRPRPRAPRARSPAAQGRSGTVVMRPILAPIALATAVMAVAFASEPSAYRESIPGTLVSFEMVLVPGEEPLYIGRTEVTWDLYDVFMLGLDKSTSTSGADAVARPSQPYGAPDYGWGHAGYPVISVTRSAAEAFCAWLSLKTGKTYRLPTEAEWTRAASAAAGS